MFRENLQNSFDIGLFFCFRLENTSKGRPWPRPGASGGTSSGAPRPRSFCPSRPGAAAEFRLSALPKLRNSGVAYFCLL